MPGLHPDDYRRQLAAKVRAHRAHRLAQAAPVIAPPPTLAVWHLITPAQHVMQIIYREATDDITLRILPGGAA